MLKLCFPVQWYLEMGPLGGNEVMRVEPFVMKFIYKKKRESFRPVSPIPTMWGQSKKTASYLWKRKRALSRTQPCQHPDLRFPKPSEPGELNVCCFSHPLYGISVIAPQNKRDTTLNNGAIAFLISFLNCLLLCRNATDFLCLILMFPAPLLNSFILIGVCVCVIFRIFYI